ncbi:hypothetical protein RM697_01755 [Ichthyenterobacterium sp. W332]|uniref:DUF1574 domain-containing protein n=1 Tax=Microcosmobacter mediterraneus TaxID=3075607 RepID=A0ABU2YJX2_9FLAO|nr:hypothetical protein [Ichthyenterobacterium sp. W332]MDT0557353.1 hypothetical protein [Ichthyenterobacterium sp. W332]
MKYFVFKIALFFFTILLSIIFLIDKRTSFFVQDFKSATGKYDIVNLGTSHGGGIKYDVINDSVFRGHGFQRAGNTLYYDLQNYKFLKPYLKKEAIVIIPLSYFSFGLDENRTDYRDPSSFVNEFYFYLPKESIYNYTHRKKVEAYLNKAKANYNSVVNERFFIREPSPASLLNIHEHVDFAVQKHRRMGDYSDSEKNVAYLGALLEDILQNNFKPVILTTPYFEGYNSQFGDVWLKANYYDFIDLILKKYDVKYLNYSNDQRISNNVNLFHNSDHLNQKGARYFSRILFQDLKDLGILKRE